MCVSVHQGGQSPRNATQKMVKLNWRTDLHSRQLQWLSSAFTVYTPSSASAGSFLLSASLSLLSNGRWVLGARDEESLV